VDNDSAPDDMRALTKSSSQLRFIANSTGQTPLHCAARVGAHRAVRALLEGVEDQNSSPFLWRSILGAACVDVPRPEPEAQCHLSCVALLLEAKAQVDNQSRKAARNHPVLMRLLGAEQAPQALRPDSLQCIVCLEQDRSTIFLPCKHLACCASCADKVTVCPFDNRKIESRINAHLN